MAEPVEKSRFAQKGRFGSLWELPVAEVSNHERAAWLENRYQKNPDIVSRQIGDESILVPIRRNVADLESVFTLGGTGVRIWELIDGRQTVGELLARVVEEFDIGPEQAEADLFEYLQSLEEIEGIRLVE